MSNDDYSNSAGLRRGIALVVGMFVVAITWGQINAEYGGVIGALTVAGLFIGYDRIQEGSGK